MAHKRKKLIQTVTEEGQILYVLDKDLKSTMIS